MLPAMADWRTDSHCDCLAARSKRLTGSMGISRLVRTRLGRQSCADLARAGPCRTWRVRLFGEFDHLVGAGDHHPLAAALLDRRDDAGVRQLRAALNDPQAGVVLDHGAAIGDMNHAEFGIRRKGLLVNARNLSRILGVL